MWLFVTMMYIIIALPITVGKILADGFRLEKVLNAAEERAKRCSEFRKRFTDFEKIQLLKNDMFGDRRKTIEKLKPIFDRFDQLRGLETHYCDYPENYDFVGILIAANEGFLYKDSISRMGGFPIKTPDGIRKAVVFTPQTIDAICRYITSEYRDRGADITFGAMFGSENATITTYGFY